MLNIKSNAISVKADAELVDAAQEFVDYLIDEMDADAEDAEEFEM